MSDVRTIAGYLPVSRQLLADRPDFRPILGPPAPPRFGPAMPTDADRYAWALAVIDTTILTPGRGGVSIQGLRDVLEDALADATCYVTCRADCDDG